MVVRVGQKGAQHNLRVLLHTVLALGLCSGARAFITIPFSNVTDAQLQSLPFLDGEHSPQETPLLLASAPGFAPATDEEFQHFLKENLEEDLSWHRRNASITLAGLRAQIFAGFSKFPKYYIGLIMLRNGTAHVYFRGTGFAKKRIISLARNLESISRQQGFQLPNTFFAVNVQDEPICRKLSHCKHAPLFSMFKRYNFKEGRSIDKDVMLPHMGHKYGSLLFYPWHQKDPRAMMRAGWYGTMEGNCTRVQLAKLSQTEKGDKLLDVGLVGPGAHTRFGFVKKPAIRKKGFVAMHDHAKWKYLINTDGHTASCRLGHIMQMNSVILKESSQWIEYYYRSLKPGVHYLSFDNAQDLLLLLQGLQGSNHEPQLRAIANASQHFGYKFISPVMKARYIQAALVRYNELFGGEMDKFITNLNIDEVKEQVPQPEGPPKWRINMIKVIRAMPKPSRKKLQG